MDCPLVTLIQFLRGSRAVNLVLRLSSFSFPRIVPSDAYVLLSNADLLSFFFKISTYNKEAQILSVCTKLVDNTHMSQSVVILQRAVFLWTSGRGEGEERGGRERGREGEGEGERGRGRGGGGEGEGEGERGDLNHLSVHPWLRSAIRES